MPEDLQKLAGSAMQQATADTSTTKRKLKKVGNVFFDEATGMWFATEDGGTSFNSQKEAEASVGGSAMSEGAQAKEGAPATSAMEPFGIEKATGTSGWGVNPEEQRVATGKSEDEEAPDKEADAIFEKNRNYIEKDMGKSQNQWRKLWKSQGTQGKKELLSFFGMDQG